MSATRYNVEQAGYPPQLLGATREPSAPAEAHLRIEAGKLGEAARMMRSAGARFVSMFLAGAPERSLVAMFALRGELVLLRSPMPDGSRSPDPVGLRSPERDGVPSPDPAGLRLPSIGQWLPAARWAERELFELHSPPRPAHQSDVPTLTAPNADSVRRGVEGLDVFVIPYGPVRSGVFEAIQFQIESGGEDVTRIRTRPYFKRRGMEARFVGLRPEVGAHVAERVAGIASCAYATAFSQAVERSLGVQAPRRAECWRAALCELERIACHLDVIAKEAETTALYVGHARFQILKEQAMRLRLRLTGSRFGRGTIVPGGVRAEGTIGLDELLRGLNELERQLEVDRRMFLGTASMTDRLIGTGRLPRALVEEYGGVGPLARGSGLSTDARHERPYGDYRRLGLRVASERDGDAMARVLVRFAELLESLRILRQTIDQLRRCDAQLRTPLPQDRSGAATGWAEAPQGELVIWVEVDSGLIGNVHIASPSLRNWALFDHAFPGDVLTDFAFIEHSFGLTPAGADR